MRHLAVAFGMLAATSCGNQVTILEPPPQWGDDDETDRLGANPQPPAPYAGDDCPERCADCVARPGGDFEDQPAPVRVSW